MIEKTHRFKDRMNHTRLLRASGFTYTPVVHTLQKQTSNRSMIVADFCLE